MPEMNRLVKEVHHAIHRKANLGSTTERFDFLSGALEDKNDPSMLKKNNNDIACMPPEWAHEDPGQHSFMTGPNASNKHHTTKLAVINCIPSLTQKHSRGT